MKIKLDANDIRLILESDKGFLEEVESKILASAMQKQLRVNMDSKVISRMTELIDKVAEDCGLRKSQLSTGGYVLTREVKEKIREAFDTEVKLFLRENVVDKIKES